MAIARLSVKVGKAGKAAAHAAYIAREGQYERYTERGEKLEAAQAGNMPAWAEHDPQQFWRAADANERKNGTTYREMEIALPRELTAAQRADLVREWVAQEIGESHAYQWAIHAPKATDGLEQPHVHLMLSERQRDGIERDPGQYFKRYNAKNPEKGGARKGYGPSAGKTLTKTERAAELKELRSRWQAMCNQHLERAGQEARIDMRSHAERGIEHPPEAKQLPSQWRGEGRAQVIEFRKARAELLDARRQVEQTIGPNMRGQIIELETARQRREKAQAERQDIERVSSRELVAEIERLEPKTAEQLLARDERMRELNQQIKTMESHRADAQHSSSQAQQRIAQLRQQHPLRARLHDSGIRRMKELDQGQAALERAQRDLQAIEQTAEGLRSQAHDYEKQARQHIQRDQMEAEQRRRTLLQEQERRRMNAPGLADARRDAHRLLGESAKVTLAEPGKPYYGRMIAETPTHWVQRLTPDKAVIHPKESITGAQLGDYGGVMAGNAQQPARMSVQQVRNDGGIKQLSRNGQMLSAREVQTIQARALGGKRSMGR